MDIIGLNTIADSFSRPVNYLRVSITDSCNLRCSYCAPHMIRNLEKGKILTFGEILRLVKIGVGLGIKKIRLTGGEPLSRKGIVGLVRRLHEIPELEDISLTTNGTLLSRKGKRLKEAGLKRINISLDTLDNRKFQKLTGADLFTGVWNGIMKTLELGYSPIKINTVVINGFNDNEIEGLARLSTKYPFHMRFIEYMPIGTDPAGARKRFLSMSEIRKRVEKIGPLVPVAGGRLDGPATRFTFTGAPGEIGFIGSMSNHFCDSCNRLRLTAAGKLRPCLLAETEVNVFDALRKGAANSEIEKLFHRALVRKKNEHQLDFTTDKILETKMVSIGG